MRKVRQDVDMHQLIMRTDSFIAEEILVFTAVYQNREMQKRPLDYSPNRWTVPHMLFPNRSIVARRFDSRTAVRTLYQERERDKECLIAVGKIVAPAVLILSNIFEKVFDCNSAARIIMKFFPV